jgi:hypothetical protein
MKSAVTRPQAAAVDPTHELNIQDQSQQLPYTHIYHRSPDAMPGYHVVDFSSTHVLGHILRLRYFSKHALRRR